MDIPLLNRTVGKGDYEEILQQATTSLGFSRLTDEQHEAISAFLSGRDVFVSLPTGSGKSLCFALIPKAVEMLKSALHIDSPFGSVMFVVSPLVSLMHDQVSRFSALGLPCVALGRLEDSQGIQMITKGECQLAFMSPETLSLRHFRDLFGEESIASSLVGIAVDEAHCINDW